MCNIKKRRTLQFEISTKKNNSFEVLIVMKTTLLDFWLLLAQVAVYLEFATTNSLILQCLTETVWLFDYSVLHLGIFFLGEFYEVREFSVGNFMGGGRILNF